jgi:hypothetical protein
MQAVPAARTGTTTVDWLVVRLVLLRPSAKGLRLTQDGWTNCLRKPVSGA